MLSACARLWLGLPSSTLFAAAVLNVAGNSSALLFSLKRCPLKGLLVRRILVPFFFNPQNENSFICFSIKMIITCLK